ncbi:MAG: hypothetical protein K2Y56_16085 [Methylobacterium sp.]|uniref:hypothetical protein n=1 Tax=Methylobacterium sp. TaxID=409 RepID=UPI0025DA51AD|nr:hypothetical protein [Methylobacterium sp.]MBX9933031.1 hypothetical protein [Methylobacterium sp.]
MRHTTDGAIVLIDRIVSAARFAPLGRSIALPGVILPLFLIRILKFTAIEVDVLEPLINRTLWRLALPRLR